MLTRALFLATGWLVLGFVVTVLRGARLRVGSRGRSLAWLLTVLLCGDVWALLTFGVPLEVLTITAASLLFGWWWIKRLPNWNGLGHTTWVMTLVTALLYLAYSFSITAFSPLHPLAFLAATTLFFVELAALALAVTHTYETLDVCCRTRWNRHGGANPHVPGYFPKVSIHVPAYNEPPALVEATLRSLARLDYANYEVILVDNNTPDEANWRRLEAVCRELGPGFRFLHLDKWPGYKSGALNFALALTAPDAEIISIVDADYQVRADFLRDLTPYFADPQIAFVQTPQDYRDYEGNTYLEACYHGYKYFFEISMPSRNEHNAIIFAGTMGLLRKAVLQEVGGWDEWCITEDAEVSLRILQRGYQSIFVNRTYGRGLMPFTFEGLKKQRFRWCFGGMQILKKHWEALMPWARRVDPESHLTWGQRYYYLVSGLQWFSDPLNLVFAVFLVMGGLMSLSPYGMTFRPLTGPFMVMPVIFLGLSLWRFLWALRNALRLSWRQAIQAMGNFLSLGWTVTLGGIQGLKQRRGVFMRTAKTKSRSGMVHAVRVTQWETALGIGCAVLSATLLVSRPGISTISLAALLGWQASVYLAAPLCSLLSHQIPVPRPLPSREDIWGWAIGEARAARWVAVVLLLLLLSGSVVHTLPTPGETPSYARFQPIDIPPRQLVVPRLTWTPPPSPRLVATQTPALDGLRLPSPSRPPGPTEPRIPTSLTPTQSPIPAQPPTPSPPAPTQPSVPTQQPTPTPLAPTEPPVPTHPVTPTPPAPTEPPVPTHPVTPTLPAPTEPPVPTQPPVPTPPAPTQPPIPTQRLRPTPPTPGPP